MGALMAHPEESGFLSRWSSRKQALREGKPLAEPAQPAKLLPSENLKQNQPIAGIEAARDATTSIANTPQVEEKEPLPPAPTMRDVHELTPQSDFKPFMRADVSPQVKNAAMKQLFKDPHFNVMDMMDIYVDDYSKPDPLPPEMLRKMAVTQFLGFWDEDDKEAAEKKAREDAKTQEPQNVAQSEPVNTQETTAAPEQIKPETQVTSANADTPTHDHPDLQLQPDDAAGRQAALRSAG
jgi:Protein of unknown function (DUF3306)